VLSSDFARRVRRSTGSLTANVQARHVLLRGRITRQVASCSIARLLVLATDRQHQPILVNIDSPGGSIFESLGVISTINGIRCPVATFCQGQVGGTAAAIAAHGLKGYRAAPPQARFSLKLLEPSQPRRGNTGSESFLHLLADTLAADTGKPAAEVMRWLEEGIEFSAQEAQGRGLIDLISAHPVLPPVTREALY
jgi:ATP-dependent Clp protease protease subunit